MGSASRKRKGALQLFTSRYQAAPLIAESGAAPVGISVWGVRFRIPYTVVARVKELMPDRAPLTAFRRGEIDWNGFESAYLDKLEESGVDPIRNRLAEVAADAGNTRLVLLCFENVSTGQRCHRRIFARWWREATGEEVPEL